MSKRDPKNESELKKALTPLLRSYMPGAVVLRHEDKMTHGIPDYSVTVRMRTSWWEVKFADPNFTHKEEQDLLVRQLYGAGYARYVIYEHHGNISRTCIVKPVQDMNEWTKGIEVVFPGIDHTSVANHIRKVHSL